jgi:hypothetical protein
MKTMGIALVAGRDSPISTPRTGRTWSSSTKRWSGGTFRGGIQSAVESGLQSDAPVVGVARDGKYNSTITEAPRSFMYMPVQQWYRADTVLHVKSSAEPGLLVPRIHEVLRALDSNVPLFDVRPSPSR